MKHVNFDSGGQEYHCRGNYTTTRQVAGDLVDLSAKFFMEKTGERSYSKAIHAVLDKDPELKKVYVGI